MSLSICAAIALACTTSGERSGAWIRAADGGAICPEGERCSSQAPGGLRFRSPSSISLGQSVMRTAVGGAQTVEFSPASSIETVVVVEQGPVGAAMRDGRSRFTHTPTSAGTSVIAVREAATGALLDRVSIQATPVSSIALQSVDLPQHSLAALWLGSAVRAQLVALDARGAPLLGVTDERQSLRSRSAAVIANGPFGLDRPALDDPRAPPIARETLVARSLGDATLDLRFGAVVQSTRVSVVDHADALEVRSIQTRGALRSPWRDESNSFAVYALAGGVPISSAPVRVRSLPSECEPLASPEGGAPALWIACATSSATPVRVPARFAIGGVELAGEFEIVPIE